MFQTFISRHNSNFFSDKLVLTSVTPASSAPVLQTPKATSSTLYFDSLTVNAGNGGFLHCIQMDTSVNAANQDRKSGSAGMPRPISYAVFCLKKKTKLSLRAPATVEISPHFGYRWGGGIETATGQKVSFEAGRAYGLYFDYSQRRDSDLKCEC